MSFFTAFQAGQRYSDLLEEEERLEMARGAEHPCPDPACPCPDCEGDRQDDADHARDLERAAMTTPGSDKGKR